MRFYSNLMVFLLIPNIFMIVFNHTVLGKAWIEFGIWHKQTQRGKKLEIKKEFIPKIVDSLKEIMAKMRL